MQRATSVFTFDTILSNTIKSTGRKSPGDEVESTTPKGKDPHKLHHLFSPSGDGGFAGGGAARHSHSYVDQLLSLLP